MIKVVCDKIKKKIELNVGFKIIDGPLPFVKLLFK